MEKILVYDELRYVVSLDLSMGSFGMEQLVAMKEYIIQKYIVQARKYTSIHFFPKVSSKKKAPSMYGPNNT